jgi:hypothetical protein
LLRAGCRVPAVELPRRTPSSRPVPPCLVLGSFGGPACRLAPGFHAQTSLAMVTDAAQVPFTTNRDGIGQNQPPSAVASGRLQPPPPTVRRPPPSRRPHAHAGRRP